MRLYVDNTKCSGCNACRVACSLSVFSETNPKKASLVIEPHFPAPGYYTVRVCTQCGDCAAVCPTEAIKQDEKGAYYVVFDECNLCEACVPECPEQVMFVRTELANTAWKCTSCGDCVAVCGTSALWLAEKEAEVALGGEYEWLRWKDPACKFIEWHNHKRTDPARASA